MGRARAPNGPPLSAAADLLPSRLATATAAVPASASAMAADDVVTEEDRALELATRPRRGVPLTPEERRVRRRLQYKLHQRRHRAKQRATTEELQDAVAQLRGDVDALERRRHALLLRPSPPARTAFGARGTATGAPMRVAMEYLRLFEHGYVDEVGQEQFLRAVMAPNVCGPDYEGVDFMLAQWRIYQSLFPFVQFSFQGFEVATARDVTVVVLDIVLVMRTRRDGVIALYPGLRHDEQVIQTMVGAALHIPGKIRFSFEAQGVCTWFATELDFVAGLQRALGSLEMVAKCLENANISFATGQILVEPSLNSSGYKDVNDMPSNSLGDGSAQEDSSPWVDDPSWTYEL